MHKLRLFNQNVFNSSSSTEVKTMVENDNPGWTTPSFPGQCMFTHQGSATNISVPESNEELSENNSNIHIFIGESSPSYKNYVNEKHIYHHFGQPIKRPVFYSRTKSVYLGRLKPKLDLSKYEE